jgi:uncharacterized protein YjhX (UPF0386 family)
MSWCVMPHTEAPIDYWVNHNQRKIWTRDANQEPPPLSEIENGIWTPYRKRGSPSTKGILLLGGAECVLGQQATLDGYRWYPKEYLMTHLELRKSQYEFCRWHVNDPDTSCAINAKTVYPSNLLWGDTVTYQWRRKRVDIFPQNGFAGYKNMPRRPIVINPENRFEKSVNYFIAHIKNALLDSDVIEFDGVSHLNCDPAVYKMLSQKKVVGEHTKVTPFHIMRSDCKAYRIPLCGLKMVVDKKRIDMYTRHLLEACEVLYEARGASLPKLQLTTSSHFEQHGRWTFVYFSNINAPDNQTLVFGKNLRVSFWSPGTELPAQSLLVKKMEPH